MEQITLDLIPKGQRPSVHVSKGDEGRTVRINLTDNGTAYTLAGTEDIKLNILKPDGTTVTKALTALAGTYVDFVTTADMTDAVGMNYAKLRINDIGTKSFYFVVEINP